MPAIKRKPATLNGRNGKAQLKYRALESNRSRELPPSRVQSADKDFDYYKRPLAWNSALDLEQNLSLIGWAVRTHLSFVSAFAFQAKTGSESGDATLTAYALERFKARHWDVQRRFDFDSMLQAFAALKAYYGDAAILKLAGGKLQLLEAWNIGKGKDAPKSVNASGLVLDTFGAIDQFAICSGNDTGELVHRQLADWGNVIYDGYFGRPTATRGASPLLPAMNHARDYMDASAFYWLKIKIASMFGLAVFSDDNTSGELGFKYNEQGQLVKAPLQFDLKPGLKLHLGKDSRAEFLESKSPPAEFIQYAKHTIRLILASFNIPYSLWDSEGATYSAQRADFNLYKQTAVREREKNRVVADEMLEHAFTADDAAGLLPLKFTEADWEMVPRGTFILDPSKEVDAIQKKLGIGACTYDDAARELGSLRPFMENIKIQGQEIATATAHKVSLIRSLVPGAAETLPSDGQPAPAATAPPADNNP